MSSRRARRHQEARAALADSVARSVLAEWYKVRPDDVARDWGRLLPKVTAMVQAGQLHAAEGTHTFMRELLGPEGADGPQSDPAQFASQAPDGRGAGGAVAQARPQATGRSRQGVGPRG